MAGLGEFDLGTLCRAGDLLPIPMLLPGSTETAFGVRL